MNRDRRRKLNLVLMLAPTLLAISLVVVCPLLFELRLSFANVNLYTIQSWLYESKLGWVGFDNYFRVFTSSPLQTVSFWQLVLRTIIWTLSNVSLHVLFGLSLALLLNKSIAGRGLYRMILILPWAMPQVIAVLAWRCEFHPQFGVINHLLNSIGIEKINWWSEAIPVFVSCVLVNVWLGIPFMMIVFLGGLQSIPPSYYEAASIDGASAWQKFFHVTLPLLKPTVVPAVTLGTIWTFNNINVIYLMTGQDGGNEFADILISSWYKSAFTYSRYSFAAAYAVIIFLMLLLMTLFWIKITKGTESPSHA